MIEIEEHIKSVGELILQNAKKINFICSKDKYVLLGLWGYFNKRRDWYCAYNIASDTHHSFIKKHLRELVDAIWQEEGYDHIFFTSQSYEVIVNAWKEFGSDFSYYRIEKHFSEKEKERTEWPQVEIKNGVVRVIHYDAESFETSIEQGWEFR